MRKHMNINFRLKFLKEEHLFTTEQKKQWFGYGEWVEEIDFTNFVIFGCKNLEYDCIIKRMCFEQNYGGYLVGYIEIPKTHPYYGLKKSVEEKINCHGGITYHAVYEKHIIGFDCAHLGDYVPGARISLPISEREVNLFDFRNPFYRNIEYCISECVEIFLQLEKFRMHPGGIE